MIRRHFAWITWSLRWLEEYVELQTVQDTTAYAFAGESCKIFSGHLPSKIISAGVCSRISVNP